MPPRHRHKPGDWLYACQRCGFTKYASEIRKEWTGLRVCDRCWDPRHPQDFVRGRKDDIAVPFASKPSDYFLTPNEVDYDDLNEVIAEDGAPVLSPDGSIVITST